MIKKGNHWNPGGEVGEKNMMRPLKDKEKGIESKAKDPTNGIQTLEKKKTEEDGER